MHGRLLFQQNSRGQRCQNHENRKPKKKRSTIDGEAARRRATASVMRSCDLLTLMLVAKPYCQILGRLSEIILFLSCCKLFLWQARVEDYPTGSGGTVETQYIAEGLRQDSADG
jgi:hypothetical protein